MPFGSAIPSRRGSDVHAVTHQVAVALLDHIRPKWMPIRNSMRRSDGTPTVALDHAVLNLDGAAHGVDQRCGTRREPRRRCASPRGLVHSDGRIRSDRCARPEAAPGCDPHRRQRARLVSTTSAARIAASFRVSIIAPLSHCSGSTMTAPTRLFGVLKTAAVSA